MYSYYQQKIISHFKDALLSKTVRHAYVISGQAGVGKKTVSQTLKLLFACKTFSACSSCNGCQSAMSGANPDIITMTNSGKNSYEIDQIRALIKSVYEKPMNSPYKLVILENAHLLGEKCQNALLKVIEEPPPYAVFVLLTDEVSMMLPTIMSRVMHMELLPWKENELRQFVSAEDFFYKYSMGNVGSLISLLKDEDFKAMRQRTLEEFEKFLFGDEFGIYEITKSWTDNKERLSDILNVITLFLRDIIFYKNGQTDLIINGDRQDAIKRVSEKITLSRALEMTDIVGNIPRRMGHNENLSMILQEMFTNVMSVKARK